MMDELIRAEAIRFLFTVVGPGVVSALVAVFVARYSKTKKERDDDRAEKFADIIEKMATAQDMTSEQLLEKIQQVTTLEKQVGDLTVGMNVLGRNVDKLTNERDDCHKEIFELRQRYGDDIERLNGDKDRLTQRVDTLSDEVQRITEPKMKVMKAKL